MSRFFLFFFIAISVFISLFYFSGFFSSEEKNTVEPQEEMIKVAFIKSDVHKSQLIDMDNLIFKLLSESKIKQNNYTEFSNVTLKLGALWTNNTKTGTPFVQTLVSNPDDRNYIFISLKKNEVPYLYTSDGSSIVEALPIKVGDKVSFVATTSSKSNLLESGYSDIDNLTSNVIVNDVRVIQVVEPSLESDSDDSNQSHSLIIALTVKQVLRLEMAQKIGAITLVPAKLANRYLSVKSSDLLEHRYGVRELRGKS